MENKTTLFDMTINGVKLTASQMADISEYYAACCTAEYLLENKQYGVTDTDTALNLAYQIRSAMDKYNLDENDAIDYIMSTKQEDASNE